ncbi:MAG: NTP transferase domain-containing protein [Candidatus Omnitrophica bacterium]|nr:NTP transferase domain-containing protein [Candidatus Omnitrophota bacterium]
MKSELPKVLHKVAGKPVLQYVLDIAKYLRSLKTYVVVGHKSELVATYVGDRAEVVIQKQLLGTADAVRSVVPQLIGYKGHVIILCGDTPLLDKDIIRRLIRKHLKTKVACTVLTAQIPDAGSYGRIIRDSNNGIAAIREFKDASFEEVGINEINVGVYCFQSQLLTETLKQVKLNPNKKEFYLTDIVELLLSQGHKVETLVTDDPNVAFGVNTREDLALCESILRQRITKRLMLEGVTIVDPKTTFIDDDVKIGRDTVIYPFTVIHGGVKIGSECTIGPFARLRPGTVIGNRVEVGNFGEISRSKIAGGTVMKHFGFIGDAHIGENVNIGAGCVTANYDGVEKSKTLIGDQAFIGSDSILVAPVVVGSGAMVGAGSVVTKGKKIPPGGLAVGVPARVFSKEFVKIRQKKV